jgi:hypothetical protein
MSGVDAGRAMSVRFGPPWSAWDRLGPDKFFSPRENLVKKWFGGLCLSFAPTPPVGVCRYVPLNAAWKKAWGN